MTARISIMKTIRLIVLLVFALKVQAQVSRMTVPSVQWQKNKWNANWITSPLGSTHEYGVHHFRKKFWIDSVPDSFVINISADQRYELFVNGKQVGRGPSRGDLLHWYYETYDIEPFLTKGENLISATVWHFGKWTPGAQISLELGLIVQGNTNREEIVNTNATWKTIRDDSYSPATGYLQDVGPGDVIDGKKYPWGWNQLDYDDSTWSSAVEVGRGCPQFVATQYIRALLPRDIPAMEFRQEVQPFVRRSMGFKINSQFLKSDSSITFAPNTKATILFDQGYLTNAYPYFRFSKGGLAKVFVTYSEAMFTDNGEKRNRNEIEGKHIIGQTDTFNIDGGENREYTTLWFRTYRYIELNIETGAEPLVFNSFRAVYTGYPYQQRGAFFSNDSTLQKIWAVGWRTARLCSGETYYDCPYYEQLQYIGDTRIQALISLVISGDDRLMRKAINNLAWSRNPEGILRSRYPARYDQFIPPFSLYWINMVHDYWMYREDDAFIKSQIETIKTILDWYAERIDPSTGMLGQLPHWNFVDWPKEWPWDENSPLGGVPPGVISGGSSILSFQLSYALGDAIDLLETFGEKSDVKKYKMLKETVNKSVRKYCYDKTRGLIVDDIARTSYSQHASIMGILSDAFSKSEQRVLFENLMTDSSLIQATIYYKFYLFRAMKKVGLADRYLDYLGDWRDMLENGLTTFAEKPEPSRSDCHGWSADPNYDLLATVCGITPASPGFKSINIKPHLGKLKFVECKMPHPRGDIFLSLKRKEGRGIEGEIVLPQVYVFRTN